MECSGWENKRGEVETAVSLVFAQTQTAWFTAHPDRIGDTVKIERAGDVIPHVLEVDLNKRNKKSNKFIFPKKCPSCGSKTEKEYNKIIDPKKMIYPA